jgi:hypothetical protein
MATFNLFQQPAKYSNVVSFCGIPASTLSISESELIVSFATGRSHECTNDVDMILGSKDNLAISSLSARVVDILVSSPD